MSDVETRLRARQLECPPGHESHVYKQTSQQAGMHSMRRKESQLCSGTHAPCASSQGAHPPVVPVQAPHRTRCRWARAALLPLPRSQTVAAQRQLAAIAAPRAVAAAAAAAAAGAQALHAHAWVRLGWCLDGAQVGLRKGKRGPSTSNMTPGPEKQALHAHTWGDTRTHGSPWGESA
eukprot:1138627-Pelagomonas_calceolata.AAC.8